MNKKIYSIISLLFMMILLFSCDDIVINLMTTSTSDDTNSTTTTTEENIAFSTISEIKNGSVGETYTTRATVIGTTTKGVLLYDENDFIFVYLGSMPFVSVNDYVEVSGVIQEHGGTLQFGTSSTISKISTSDRYTFNITELSGSEVTTYVNNFLVGECVRLTGSLSQSGNYLNLDVPETDVVGSLNTDDTSLGLNNLIGDTITVEGYVLYVSGDSTKYFNILVTDVYEETEYDTFPLTILSVNDLHGYIEQDEYGMNGLSNMAYLINKIRDENPLDDVVLIGNGDMLQGTAISNMTNGLAVIESMDAMQFDAMGIGNHEFDWEIDTIIDYFDEVETNDEADFPLLNANIYSIDDDSLLTEPGGDVLNSVVIEKEGVEVGIISYIGDTYNSIAYDKVDDYYFDLDISQSVEQIGNELVQTGVDVIVVNIHGFDTNTNYQLSTLRDQYGDYLVDVVINGHTHSYYEESINRIDGTPMPVIQAGGNGAAFGEVTLTIGLDTMEVINSTVDIIKCILSWYKL